eukprot:TCONS_00052509-protein
MLNSKVITLMVFPTCVTYGMSIKDSHRPDEFSPSTTSDGAAGHWEPFWLGDTPVDVIKSYAKETFAYVMENIKNNPDSPDIGFFTCHGFLLSKDETFKKPFWYDIPSDSRVLSKDDLKMFPSEARSGMSFTTVYTEGRRLVPYYIKRFQEMGGKVFQKLISSLDELPGDFDVVINCTGLGSRKLFNDKSMFPVRGQVLKIKAPWIKQFVTYDVENQDPMYILPNQEFVVVGGTTQKGDYNAKISLTDRKEILDKATKFIPSLKNAKVVGEWVGLRPAREKGPRIEIENFTLSNNRNLKVIHNYGHGGCGMTIHWGCANHVAKLFDQVCSQQNTRLQTSKL